MAVVIGMMWLVNVLLLLAAGRFLRLTTGILRLCLCAFLGALLAWCGLMLDKGQMPWHLGSLLLTGLCCFGVSKRGGGAILLFCLFHLSLGGLTDTATGTGPMLLGAAGLGFACLAAGRHPTVIPVELTLPDQTLKLQALWDTGNALRDPITGKPVLVVDARTAYQLTGLSSTELADPIRSLHTVKGLRLIPYHSVGNRGFLLALYSPRGKIGQQQGSVLVGLSPQLFTGNYQALTGGTL